MTLDEALAGLKPLGSEKMRAHNAKRGVGGDRYGAKPGDIRTPALELWDTGNFEARALAVGATLGVCRDYPTSPGCTRPSRRAGSTRWFGGRDDRRRYGTQPGSAAACLIQSASCASSISSSSWMWK